MKNSIQWLPEWKYTCEVCMEEPYPDKTEKKTPNDLCIWILILAAILCCRSWKCKCKFVLQLNYVLHDAHSQGKHNTHNSPYICGCTFLLSCSNMTQTKNKHIRNTVYLWIFIVNELFLTIKDYCMCVIVGGPEILDKLAEILDKLTTKRCKELSVVLKASMPCKTCYMCMLL